MTMIQNCSRTRRAIAIVSLIKRITAHRDTENPNVPDASNIAQIVPHANRPKEDLPSEFDVITNPKGGIRSMGIMSQR
ncbi:unnamed protein product [Protopolystoma xenopodis]|uniref:Uncharacterized protein n=1 Tax=Protopolystoma xenopodis TaxID=117903 RepID=A0A3S5C9A1_9PLAT|nr:unnamed protein product [Protopolystoma xenopodis]